MTKLMKATKIVPTMIQRNTQEHKRLQTQMPTFNGQKKRYNEFEHLLLNYIRPFRQNITQEERLQFFTSLLREDAIEFLQTIRVTPDIPTYHSGRSSRCSVKKTLEITSRKYRDTNEINSNMTTSTNLFLISSKSSSRQQNKQLNSKTIEKVNAFFFGKLPIATVNFDLICTFLLAA